MGRPKNHLCTILAKTLLAAPNGVAIRRASPRTSYWSQRRRQTRALSKNIALTIESRRHSPKPFKHLVRFFFPWVKARFADRRIIPGHQQSDQTTGHHGSEVHTHKGNAAMPQRGRPNLRMCFSHKRYGQRLTS